VLHRVCEAFSLRCRLGACGLKPERILNEGCKRDIPFPLGLGDTPIDEIEPVVIFECAVDGEGNFDYNTRDMISLSRASFGRLGVDRLGAEGVERDRPHCC